MTQVTGKNARSTIASTLAVALVAAATLSACATRPHPTEDPDGFAEYIETNDPLEPFNRAMFDFNRGFDKVVLTPLGIFYRDILPPIMQEGFDNALANFRGPVIFFNDLLQWQPERAGTTLARLVINSTAGLGGLADVAKHLGLERHNTDFGMTLAGWGMAEGPYIMLPVLGPTNPRDAAGRAVDSLILDPFGLLSAIVFEGSPVLEGISYGVTGMSAMSLRAKALEPLDELEKSSLDFYAAVRSAYRQNRRFEIKRNFEAGADGSSN